MNYRTPEIKSIGISELLVQLGPARALLYAPASGGTQPLVPTNLGSEKKPMTGRI